LIALSRTQLNPERTKRKTYWVSSNIPTNSVVLSQKWSASHLILSHHATPPTLKLADIPQPVVQREINREPCLFAKEDYHCNLHWLQKTAADWHCDIHAYVLMINHEHLLATSEKPEGIAKMM
jgi:hypothetical protein